MGRREENKRRKREALEQAALEAFRAKGYEGASIEQIAAVADVARGTFYLYFPDKEAAFRAVMARWYSPVMVLIGEVEGALEQASTPVEARAVYTQMAVVLAGEVLAHAAEVEVAFRESRQPGLGGQAVRDLEAQILAQVTAFTAGAAAKGLITVADPRLFSLVVFGAVERLVYEALQGADLGNPVAVAAQVLAWFARALELAESPQ